MYTYPDARDSSWSSGGNGNVGVFLLQELSKLLLPLNVREKHVFPSDIYSWHIKTTKYCILIFGYLSCYSYLPQLGDKWFMPT